jgi:hypothetical protein
MTSPSSNAGESSPSVPVVHGEGGEQPKNHSFNLGSSGDGPESLSSTELPALLFDGYYVYAEGLTEQARLRTSPENVSDVLDAVVRLFRAQLPKDSPLSGAKQPSEKDKVSSPMSASTRSGEKQ